MPCSWLFFLCADKDKKKQKDIWDQNHFNHMIYCMHAACNRNNMLLSIMFGLWLIYFFIPQLPRIIQTAHCSPNAQKRPNSCKYPSLNVTFELDISLWQMTFCSDFYNNSMSAFICHSQTCHWFKPVHNLIQIACTLEDGENQLHILIYVNYAQMFFNNCR